MASVPWQQPCLVLLECRRSLGSPSVAREGLEGGGGGGVRAQQGRFPRSREHRALQVSSQGGTANTGVALELCELSQLPQDKLLLFFI